jgi:hypothetical protein
MNMSVMCPDTLLVPLERTVIPAPSVVLKISHVCMSRSAGDVSRSQEGSKPSLDDTSQSSPKKLKETTEAKVVSEERLTRSCRRITAAEWLSLTPKHQCQLRLEERRAENEKKKDGIKIGALVQKKLVCCGVGDTTCTGMPKMVFGIVLNSLAKGHYKVKFENGFLLNLFYMKFTFITNIPKQSVLACDNQGNMMINTAGGLASSGAEVSKKEDNEKRRQKKW